MARSPPLPGRELRAVATRSRSTSCRRSRPPASTRGSPSARPPGPSRRTPPPRSTPPTTPRSSPRRRSAHVDPRRPQLSHAVVPDRVQRFRLCRRSHRRWGFSVHRAGRGPGSLLAGRWSAAPAVAGLVAQTPLDQLARPTPRTPEASSPRRCCGRADQRRCADQRRTPEAPSRCSGGSRADGSGCRASRPSARTGESRRSGCTGGCDPAGRRTRTVPHRTSHRSRHTARSPVPGARSAVRPWPRRARSGALWCVFVSLIVGVPRWASTLCRMVSTPTAEIEVHPTQGEDLAAPGAGDQQQPDQQAPLDVFGPRSGHDARRVLRARRVGVRRRHPRLLHRAHRVDRNPSPPDRRRVGAAEHRVALADRRRGQRLAGVRRTPLVALVRPRRPVLDERPATAATSAHPELGVELLVRARALLDQDGQRLITQRRADELLDQRRVREARAALDRVAGQPLGPAARPA